MSLNPKLGQQTTDDEVITEYFKVTELMDAWVDGYNNNPPLF